LFAFHLIEAFEEAQLRVVLQLSADGQFQFSEDCVHLGEILFGALGKLALDGLSAVAPAGIESGLQWFGEAAPERGEAFADGIRRLLIRCRFHQFRGLADIQPVELAIDD